MPENVVRRRFKRSFRNFWTCYRETANRWMLFDNSAELPVVLAQEIKGKLRIVQKERYNQLIETL